MAIVNKLEHLVLDRDSNHTTASCTYPVIENVDGRFFQIDSYGLKSRQEKVKKSQSIRFLPQGNRAIKSNT
ncbi:MAG: hypothetical protein GXO85_12460 [Chlorobi bacterium]|nr:hypothetical protein [Chlorobiota bacterium]